MIWRKQYIINPKLQFKIVLFLAGTALAFSLLIMLFVYTHLRTLQPPDPNLNSLMIRLALVVSIMTVYFLVAGFMLTNQIAGPIWRLQAQLEKVLKGEAVAPLKFRDGDEFQELAIMINQLLDKKKN